MRIDRKIPGKVKPARFAAAAARYLSPTTPEKSHLSAKAVIQRIYLKSRGGADSIY